MIFCNARLFDEPEPVRVPLAEAERQMNAVNAVITPTIPN
jgi:hypothetical protein